MAQRILFLLLALLLPLAGCDLWDHSGDDPGDGGDEPDSTALLPLAEGNHWVMAFTRFDAEGTLTESYTDTLRVVGDTTVAGERWAEVRCAQTPVGCIPGGYYANREDGVWKWHGPSSDEAPYLLYKYPAETGDTYDLPAAPSYTLTVSVLETEAPVETPAGTFAAYHYQLDTDEIDGLPVSEGAAQTDRYLIPAQGFASIGCAYVSLQGGEEFVRVQEFGWELIAFEGN